MAEKVEIRTWARELDGSTTMGDKIAFPRGGLREAFAYLAELDWKAYTEGLPEVQSGGFMIYVDGLRIGIQIKQTEK